MLLLPVLLAAIHCAPASQPRPLLSCIFTSVLDGLLLICRGGAYIVKFPFVLLNFLIRGKDSDYSWYFFSKAARYRQFVSQPVRRTPPPGFPESDGVVCVTASALSGFAQRRDALSDTARQIHGAVSKIASAADQKPLNAQLDALENRRIECAAPPAPVAVPTSVSIEGVPLPEGSSEFVLLDIVPKAGIVIEPHWTARLLSALTQDLRGISIGSGAHYRTIEANLTYATEQAVNLRAVIFKPVANDSCAISEFSIYIWSSKDELLASTGKLSLQKGVLTDQRFELPTLVEAKRVRIVVHKNWGNPNETCFHGVLFDHA
jgi:hypothetical protein